MPPDAAAQLDALARLWARERRATAARLAAQRRELTLAERVARGLALRDLRVEETAAAPGGRLLLWLASGRAEAPAQSRIGPGDPVRLWWTDPDGAEAVRGVVARRQGSRLAVMVDEGPETLERLEGSGFRLDRDEPESTFDRGEAAIAAFRAARASTDMGRLRAVLFEERAPGWRREASGPCADAGLNAGQRAAVARALDAEDLALIHGPPGTGKTRTLSEVARQAAARGERVLATAASNAAVDNLAERLVASGLAVVRLGHPARVSPAVEAHTLDALVARSDDAERARRWMAEADRIRRRTQSRDDRGGLGRDQRHAAYQEASDLMRDARRQLRNAEAVVLARAQVVLATAAGADSAALGAEPFDLVLVDEATQATDPVLLVPLARARRAVLAGDPRQLPPTVIDPEAAREGLASTFFERLAAGGCAETLARLDRQYRMHAAIMAFPSASMYGGRLAADDSVAARRLADLPGVEPDPLRPGPWVFLDTAGTGWDERRGGDDPSTENPEQAGRVAAELRRLVSRGLPPREVAVICPYRAQVRRLRELLAAELAAGLEVDTVDAFQGREKEAVVVDLVRSNPDGALGFLEDTRRMNVALTRARRFLLVVGDSATLGGHPFYAAFLAAAEAAGAWLSAWSDDAAPLH